MKRNLYCLLICFLGVTLSAVAQKKNNANNTLLWEVSGNGLKKPSYLFGTYHFADKGFVDTMKILNDKLASTAGIVGELIINQEVAMKLLPYMMMKGNTLDKLLTEQEYNKVNDYMKEFGKYDLKMFNTMKPMMVQTLFLQFTSPKTFTADNPAIDQYFQDYGKANHKSVIGLETVEEQAAILFGDNLERQKEQLLKFLAEKDKNAIESKALYQNYITQDLKAMEKMFADTGDYTQEEMDRMLKNRNQKWLVKLPEMMQKQSLFIAVGAGHLVGEDGLIKGLQAKGYSVKPVKTN